MRVEIDNARMEATIFICYDPRWTPTDEELEKEVEELRRMGYAVGYANGCVRCAYSSMWCKDPRLICPYER
jgi:hypothetical protein